MTGLDIPYTLNFIEAWMTGTPLVAYATLDRLGKFFEVDRLVSNNVDGIVCRSVEDVVEACRRLARDRDAAAAIGANGRASAIRHFGRETITREWEALLTPLGG